jgi:hypothetical protein
MLLKATDQSRSESEGYNMKKMLWALALFGMACAVGTAHAIPVPTGNPNEFVVKFSASGFMPLDPQGEPPPTDPVTGSVTYRAASINSPIDSLVSIDLEIDGHTYIANDQPNSEVGSAIIGGMQLVGGNNHGVDQVAPSSDDFLLQWDLTTFAFGSFLYTSIERELDTYTTATVGNPVSEPATLPLAALAMGLIAVFAGRHRKVNRAVPPQTIAGC